MQIFLNISLISIYFLSLPMDYGLYAHLRAHLMHHFFKKEMHSNIYSHLHTKIISKKQLFY